MPGRGRKSAPAANPATTRFPPPTAQVFQTPPSAFPTDRARGPSEGSAAPARRVENRRVARSAARRALSSRSILHCRRQRTAPPDRRRRSGKIRAGSAEFGGRAWRRDPRRAHFCTLGKSAANDFFRPPCFRAMAGAGLNRRAFRLLRMVVASHRKTGFHLSEANDEHASKVEMPLFVIEI